MFRFPGRLPGRAVLVLAVLVSVAACGGNGSGPPGADQSAEVFYNALGDADLDRACSMLAPATLEAAEQAENGQARSCTDMLASVALPEAGEPVSSRAYGRNAQVVFEQDTVFLTLSGGTWKVLAAGCTEREDRPYNCLIEGD